MNWFQSILYALISGITEFLPVSSGAHQSILLALFGETSTPIALHFTIHLGALAAAYINCQNYLAALSRTRRILIIPERRRKRQPDPILKAEVRIFQTGSTIAAIMALLSFYAENIRWNLSLVAIVLLINGIVLYITSRISLGNKTAVSMNRFDSIILGFFAGLGVLPGLSRIALGCSSMVFRGASTKNALNWVLCISIPVLCAVCVADIIAMFVVGVVGFGFVTFLQCLVAAVFSYAGATLAIYLLRFMAVKMGYSSFSFYCWGLALFSFLLYMI